MKNSNLSLLIGKNIMTNQNTTVENAETVTVAPVVIPEGCIYHTTTKFNYNRIFHDHPEFLATKAEFTSKGISFEADKDEEKGEFIKKNPDILKVFFVLDLQGDKKLLGGLLETFIQAVIKRNDDIKSAVGTGDLTELVIDSEMYQELTRKAVKAASTKVSAEAIEETIAVVFSEIETFSALAEKASDGDKTAETIRDAIVDLLEGKCSPAKCQRSQLPRTLKETIRTRLVELSDATDSEGNKTVTDEETLAVIDLWTDALKAHFDSLDAAEAMSSMQL